MNQPPILQGTTVLEDPAFHAQATISWESFQPEYLPSQIPAMPNEPAPTCFSFFPP